MCNDVLRHGQPTRNYIPKGEWLSLPPSLGSFTTPTIWGMAFQDTFPFKIGNLTGLIMCRQLLLLWVNVCNNHVMSKRVHFTALFLIWQLMHSSCPLFLYVLWVQLTRNIEKRRTFSPNFSPIFSNKVQVKTLLVSWLIPICLRCLQFSQQKFQVLGSPDLKPNG